MAKRDVPPARHSDASADKAAQLREIAAEVREVPGSFKEEEPNFWNGRVAFGRLIVEAYNAGAWLKEGSVIGHKLGITLTLTDRDRPFGSGKETVPAWLVEAASAVLDTLTEHMVPPDHERAQVEWEAEILANEIEREAHAATGRRDGRSKGAVFNRTSGVLTVNGTPLARLEHGEKDVLALLVEKGAASFGDLKKAHDRPDRVLKALRTKYPALKKHIILPGGPGRGGYTTTIALEE
jgi:hypothetical protein